VGVGLGIAAVFQKNEKKMFGILGLAINGLIAIPQLALLIIFISGPPMQIAF